MSDLDFDFSDLDAACDFMDFFGAGLSDVLRTAGRQVVLTIMACAIPASSGAADELEYYGGAAYRCYQNVPPSELASTFRGIR